MFLIKQTVQSVLPLHLVELFLIYYSSGIEALINVNVCCNYFISSETSLKIFQKFYFHIIKNLSVY